MSYELFEHDNVKRFFKKHKNDRELLLRINRKYREISINPHAADFKQLKSIKCPKCHRARVGNYRIIFYINDSKRQIEILDIIPRRNDYRFFIF
ncbi:hypothetical protein [Methanobrevibacter sp.]|uniref:type II toxin-antitoxin system RelE family toxin n=1 Tax=Methanobrevibacter sp. TaxID=66852 RepID=UPI0025FEA498|nr:hypothetical protein [Methanobrevibacter sp.]MBQ2962720.1 hypothetical protein [Methanobrevibacter sp.]